MAEENDRPAKSGWTEKLNTLAAQLDGIRHLLSAILKLAAVVVAVSIVVFGIDSVKEFAEPPTGRSVDLPDQAATQVPSGPPVQTGGNRSETPPAESRVSKEGYVRCPGGGDWLGRERNRRESSVSIDADDGWEIVAGSLDVDTLEDNDGGYGNIEEHSEGNRLVKASVRFWCNPDNYPGAGGGWMRIRLSGIQRQLYGPTDPTN